MSVMVNHLRRSFFGAAVVVLGVLCTGCASSTPAETAVPQAEPAVGANETTAPEHTDEQNEAAAADMLALPNLAAAELNGRPLRVVATTSIIGDVVAQVGGEAIDLTTLMGPGQDPHGYEPAARDLTAVSEADVIFVNGWDLEEGLVGNLRNIGEKVPIVPVSANIVPQEFGGHDEEHDHRGVNPHVWFSIHNVEQWVDNIVQVLSALDPANAANYERNAAAYQTELQALADYAEAELSQIPPEKRFLVTNHDALGYLAADYDLTVLGTIIPSRSTLAEPSARDLSALIETMTANNVCTIFTETTVSDSLAQTAAAELDGCENVQVIKLYTGAVGPTGSGADSYTGMFRANVDALVSGLK